MKTEKIFISVLSLLRPNALAVRLTFNALLPMLYLYFRSIYLFHVILSSCLSSGSLTGPQQLVNFFCFLFFKDDIFTFPADINSCLNFCDKAWWFLSSKVFGLLAFLYSQRFGLYALWPSDVSCQTQEPNWQSSGDCWFNPDCRWVRIQEFWTFLPSYG